MLRVSTGITPTALRDNIANNLFYPPFLNFPFSSFLPPTTSPIQGPLRCFYASSTYCAYQNYLKSKSLYIIAIITVEYKVTGQICGLGVLYITVSGHLGKLTSRYPKKALFAWYVGGILCKCCGTGSLRVDDRVQRGGPVGRHAEIPRLSFFFFFMPSCFSFLFFLFRFSFLLPFHWIRWSLLFDGVGPQCACMLKHTAILSILFYSSPTPLIHTP
ncbi:hypothetical protein F4810DRAFT_698181 [Camillea tinctor]|nr:hypothetical protein F4810DRAFT_698181 [Camillea tinctor]